LASCVLLVWSLASVGQGTGGTASVPAARQATNVAIITIHGPIDQTTAQSVIRRLQLSQRAGADAIVIDLNTPGGEVGAVLAITAALKDSSIPNTVAWIHPDAYSGGAVVAWACREIVAAPNASVGDALPIFFDPKTGGLKTVTGDLLKKFLPPLMADLVDSARRFGRDEYLVQAMCNDTVELWVIREKATDRLLCIDQAEYKRLFGQDPDPGLPRIPAVSPSRPPPAPAAPNGETSPKSAAPSTPREQQYRPASPALEEIAGAVDEHLGKRGGVAPTQRPHLRAEDRDQWEVVSYLTNGTGPLVLKHDDLEFLRISAATIANDEELKAFFGARNLTRLDPSWSEGLYAFLTWMPVRGLLVAVFLLALFIEMTHPGAMLPGGVAFFALVALVAPPLIINLSAWWAAAAIVAGIVFIALEVLVIPGFGVFGVAGLLLLFGGLVGIIVPSTSLFPDTAAERRDLLSGVVTLLLALATSGAGMYLFARHFRSLPVFNRLILKTPDGDIDSGDEMLAAMGPATGVVKKGAVGTTLTPLRPAGRVELADSGRIIDVVAEMGYIPAGSRVRVVAVSDFRIGVERVEEPGAGPPGDRVA
jgi:membrane-bound ClpP family serine protease